MAFFNNDYETSIEGTFDYDRILHGMAKLSISSDCSKYNLMKGDQMPTEEYIPEALVQTNYVPYVPSKIIEKHTSFDKTSMESSYRTSTMKRKNHTIDHTVYSQCDTHYMPDEFLYKMEYISYRASKISRPGLFQTEYIPDQVSDKAVSALAEEIMSFLSEKDYCHGSNSHEKTPDSWMEDCKDLGYKCNTNI